MFVKLFSQILDSSIADDRRLRHFFTDILLCADAQGFVMMTEAAISRRIGASIEEVEWGIAELMKPDPRSKTLDNEGRRLESLEGSGYGWRIINFESYKSLRSAEDMRDKTRERVRRFRDKQKGNDECNADVTPCNASNPIQSKSKIESKSNIPPTPQGDEVVKKRVLPTGWERWPLRKQKSERVNYNNKLMGRIGRFFNQRETTLWTVADAGLLSKINPEDQDVALMEKYYLAPSIGEQDIRRKDLPTLLNNWNGELNRANIWKSQS